METNEHVMLCVLGRTACGKDSLTNKLCERTKLNAITSYTTRPRRENEGDTHIFTTKEVYEQMKAEGNVAAYTEIAGYLYWTTIDQLYKNDIYIIDYDGLKTLKALLIRLTPYEKKEHLICVKMIRENSGLGILQKQISSEKCLKMQTLTMRYLILISLGHIQY